MKLIETGDIDFWYIDGQDALDQMTLLWSKETVIGCDTETYIDLDKINASALDAHSSKVSLIQINVRGNKEPWLIDVIGIGVEGCMNFINTIMMNDDILKVFHNARFDIKQFKSTFDVWIKNVACTMVLAKSLGITTGMKASIFRGHGLKDVCRDFFDVRLDKTQQASQWGARPLQKTQLSYAALDVGAFKDGELTSYLLELYDLFTTQLDELNQQVAYIADQQAAYIAAKLEYAGMYINLDILEKVLDYAKEETIKYRKILVEELGFTVYNDVDIDEETGEWIAIQVIPDKIKTLLNNNKGLVSYINEHLRSHAADALTSLQAEEVKNYLDELEKDVDPDNKDEWDEDYLNYRYESITLIKSLLKYKKYNKLWSECEKYIKVINRNTDKVHAGFNSVGTSTGRMSSAGALNLQQVSNTQAVIEIEREQF